MADQYFTAEPGSKHKEQEFSYVYRGSTLRFTTDAGTFSKDHVDAGTELLLKALPQKMEGNALDLGCGWGCVGCCMKAVWPQLQITLSDVNRRALHMAKRNLESNRLDAVVVESDGLDAVEGTFNYIITNPPIRAGKNVIYRLFAQASERLRQDGVLMIVIRTKQGADSAIEYLETLFSSVSIVERGGGFKVIEAKYPLSVV